MINFASVSSDIFLDGVSGDLIARGSNIVTVAQNSLALKLDDPESVLLANLTD
jgi:hypothetical protein